MVRLRLAAIAVSLVWGVAGQLASITTTAADNENEGSALSRINHVVIIYQENHSFDNLYGGWEGVNGRGNATAARTIQVGQTGVPYRCLLQNDVNLSSPPQPADCADATTATAFVSHFPNAPFQIDAFIPSSAQTCPQPGVFAPHGLTPNPANLAGGCTEDIVHRFYQEQYQLDGGKQDRYTTGSDAVGLTQGFYDTRALPVYAYLHGEDLSLIHI